MYMRTFKTCYKQRNKMSKAI